MQIAANKIKGIRAARCQDCYSARLARQHNNANILCLGARVVSTEKAKKILKCKEGYMIGDSIFDIQAGKAAKFKTAFNCVVEKYSSTASLLVISRIFSSTGIF